MKSTDFFKQLNEEIDAHVPPLSESLKEAPIRTGEKESFREAEPAPVKKSFRRRWIGVVGVAAAFVLFCAAALWSFARYLDLPSVTLMQVDINPSLVLVLDRDFKVEAAVSNNADGDLLLSDEEFAAGLVGLSSEQAAVQVTERAAMYGFIDLENEGALGDYNEVNVTLTSNGRVLPARETEIEEGLTQYFCDKGVYLYAKVQTVRDHSITGEAYKQEERLTYLRIENREELEAYADLAVYSYAEELLFDAFYKFDLFEEIEALEQAIRSHPDNTYQRSWWTISSGLTGELSELCGQMKEKLTVLKVFYGMDFTERTTVSEWGYLAAEKLYRLSLSLVDLDALRALLREGCNGETFGGIENISVRLNYFGFVSNDLFQDIVTDLFNGHVATLSMLVRDVSSLLLTRAESLCSRFSVLYNAPRSAIGEEAYAAFLLRIGK